MDLRTFTESDDFGDIHGRYTISSIYFDNDDKQCYYETLNKQAFRQKLRLRVYNSCDTENNAFFEIKMKEKGLVRKRRTSILIKDAEDLLDKINNNEEKLLDLVECSNKQILKEILFLISFRDLRPAALVSYDRLALSAKEESDLRITFDSAIRSREKELQLTKGSFGSPVVNDNTVIMEIKTGSNVPLWLAHLLAKYNCKEQSFSKYCLHYSKGENLYEYESNKRSYIKAGSY
jgi:hypothetical protein